MEHVLDEQMRTMVEAGDIPEESYMRLINVVKDEKNKSETAPLFDVAYVANTVTAYSYIDVHTDGEMVKLQETTQKHACIMYAVKGVGWSKIENFLAGRLLLNPSGNLHGTDQIGSGKPWGYRPGLQFKISTVELTSFTVYTVLDIKPYKSVKRMRG